MAKRQQVKGPGRRKGADTRGLPGSKKGTGKTVDKNRERGKAPAKGRK